MTKSSGRIVGTELAERMPDWDKSTCRPRVTNEEHSGPGTCWHQCGSSSYIGEQRGAFVEYKTRERRIRH